MVDPFEKKIKNIGFSLFFDSENNNHFWVDTSSKSVREKIAKEYKLYVDYFKKSFQKNGADTISIMTDESYIIKLYTLH